MKKGDERVLFVCLFVLEGISGVCRVFVVSNLHVLGAFPSFLMLNQPLPFESGANEMGRF